jgi:hypothetical protein
LAFLAFYQDKINVSLPKNYKLRVALTPTKSNNEAGCTYCYLNQLQLFKNRL